MSIALRFTEKKMIAVTSKFIIRSIRTSLTDLKRNVPKAMKRTGIHAKTKIKPSKRQLRPIRDGDNCQSAR